MKKQMKNLSGLFRRASRAAKKGVRNATRRVRKFFSRGGAPNVIPPGPVPTEAVNAKPRSRRHRKRKGAFRRVTNAVRRVGKGIRNTLKRVFSKKTKHRRRTKKSGVQQGSAKNNTATNNTVTNNTAKNNTATNNTVTNNTVTNNTATNNTAKNNTTKNNTTTNNTAKNNTATNNTAKNNTAKNGNLPPVLTAAETPGIPAAPPL